MSNKRVFYLLKHLHCPVITVWYLPLATCAGNSFMFPLSCSPEAGGLLWLSAYGSSRLDEVISFMPAKL